MVQRLTQDADVVGLIRQRRRVDLAFDEGDVGQTVAARALLEALQHLRREVDRGDLLGHFRQHHRQQAVADAEVDVAPARGQGQQRAR